MDEAEKHSVDFIEIGAWQSPYPIVQAQCSCGWETHRKALPREVVEEAARRHLGEQLDRQ